MQLWNIRTQSVPFCLPIHSLPHLIILGHVSTNSPRPAYLHPLTSHLPPLTSPHLQLLHSHNLLRLTWLELVSLRAKFPFMMCVQMSDSCGCSWKVEGSGPWDSGAVCTFFPLITARRLYNYSRAIDIFRTDGHPVLASASSSGNIALWDLNSGGRLLHMVRGAHDGAISAVEWVPGQPVLISSGEDNSVKVNEMYLLFTKIHTDIPSLFIAMVIRLTYFCT